jgi:DNA polymerase-3 subunit beta
MSTEVLSSAVSNTIFATSSDELRPAMTGVYINLSDTNTTFVATDGHRLIRYRRVDVASSSPASLIIPRKALNLLKSTLPSENVPVSVEFNQSNAYFKFNNIKMICRLIDERFPDYRIAIYANKTTHQVRLKLTGSELMISAEDLDFSNEANERLSCEHDGEDIEIGFNAKFLVEMLNNLSCKEVSLKFSAPNRAGLILPAEQDENEDILMLVMPVMLNNYV